MGGSDSTATTDSTQQLILPQWVQDAGKSNYGTAQQLAQTPYTAAMDQKVAGTTAPQTQAYGLMGSAAGAEQPAMSQAGSAIGGLMSYQPSTVAGQNVTAGTVAGANLDPYLNPFTKNVIDTSMQSLEQQRQTAINANNAGAVAAHSFGGDRAAVTNGVTNAQTALGAGQLAAGLNQANYQNAQGLLQGDITRKLGADEFNSGQNVQVQQANQSAGLAGQNFNLNAANSLQSQAAAQQDARFKDYQGLLDSGSRQQAQTQAELDAKRNNAQAPYQFSQDKLNMLLSSLGMTPYNKTQTGHSVTDTQTASDPMTTLLGVGKLALGAAQLSDRRLKKNVIRIGERDGLPLYAYHYIFGGPQQIGHMADEVEALYPDAVIDIGGYKAVNYARIG